MRQRKSRRRKPSRVAARWFFVILILSVAGKLTYDFLLSMSRLEFNPDKVVVEGNSLVSDAEVLDMLHLQAGTNILSIDTGALEKKLKTSPRITDAEVKRDFPDGLYVEITEVVPAGYLIDKGVRYTVTSEGDVYLGDDGPDIEFKAEARGSLRSLTAFLSVLERADKDFYGRIKSLEADYRNGVMVKVGDFMVYWPSVEGLMQEDIAADIVLVNKVEEKYRKEGKTLRRVDLRYLEHGDEGIKGALVVK